VNDVLSFQRARKPEEQQLRREAILAAAAALFDAEGPQGAGLNAIAARAGFTKSNVYRYFESREEVLMNLFLGELEAFVDAFEARVATCAVGDLDALADCATLFVAHPRFCALLSIIASVLEQNVSVEKIIALKRGVSRLNVRIATAMASRLPGTSLEDCAWVVGIVATLVAGMWPHTTPSAAAAEVLAMPEFAYLRPTPERDLSRAFRALLKTIA
jgi:TetR/AcrR family transcriptional regulator